MNEEMDRHDKLVQFIDEMRMLIKRHTFENDLMTCEIIGAIEWLKYSIMDMAGTTYREDDDGCP